ncbi:MAG: hypothetical protein KC543_06055 [Myxococcales bacterium]|nr:hypothetical protein [Myxococcales bacterium]
MRAAAIAQGLDGQNLRLLEARACGGIGLVSPGIVSCDDFTVMLTLASIERSLPKGMRLDRDLETDEWQALRNARRNACGDTVTVVDTWPSGRFVVQGRSTLLYPNGQVAHTDDGEWKYPSGRKARSGLGTWYYPNGATARSVAGKWLTPGGAPLRDLGALEAAACKAVGKDLCTVGQMDPSILAATVMGLIIERERHD